MEGLILAPYQIQIRVVQMDWRKWVPTSKMTAVGISGGFVIWGVWAMYFYYEILLEPWVAAFWTLGISFSFGYVVTEHRETVLRLTKEIHDMVNSRMTEALDRIDQLNETIRDAGIVSPEKPESHGN